VSITLAQLGWIHEMGNEHVPPRPFLIPGLQERRSELQTLAGALLARVLNGQMSKRDALGQLGATGQTMVQDKLRRGPFHELEESTVRRKGSSQPLIDTGQMMQNVQWEFDDE
jgi:hypothetical protein